MSLQPMLTTFWEHHDLSKTKQGALSKTYYERATVEEHRGVVTSVELYESNFVGSTDKLAVKYPSESEAKKRCNTIANALEELQELHPDVAPEFKVVFLYGCTNTESDISKKVKIACGYTLNQKASKDPSPLLYIISTGSVARKVMLDTTTREEAVPEILYRTISYNGHSVFLNGIGVAAAPTPTQTLNKRTVPQLKGLLRDRGLSATGLKAVLVQRLVDADAAADSEADSGAHADAAADAAADSDADSDAAADAAADSDAGAGAGANADSLSSRILSERIHKGPFSSAHRSEPSTPERMIARLRAGEAVPSEEMVALLRNCSLNTPLPVAPAPPMAHVSRRLSFSED
ncbi:hypothetical protein B484DRAFT_137523 [Ochromonadaceae sp. CCMP2298]|nr:hypothetical protein B484DRAFT_137523 [Ochromonadaceae sp. CCMP2298]